MSMTVFRKVSEKPQMRIFLFLLVLPFFGSVEEKRKTVAVEVQKGVESLLVAHKYLVWNQTCVLLTISAMNREPVQVRNPGAVHASR